MRAGKLIYSCRLKLLLLAATLLAGLLGGNRRLEYRRGFERKCLRGCNLHGSAGLRVAARAGGACLHLEGTEAHELDFIGAYCILDGIEHGVKSRLCALLGCTFTEFSLNAVNELSLIHRPSY